MADQGKAPDDSAADPQSGVLGNLPRSRPSVRSPRRDASAPKARDPHAEGPAAKTEPPRSAPPREASGPAGEDSPAPDLEALARGGIAIAGGAASLGLRIAGRAAAAVRGAVERR